VAADPPCSAVPAFGPVIDHFGCGSPSQHVRPVVTAPQRPIGVEMAKLTYAAIASLDGYVEDAVGGGKRALPDNARAQLELVDERRFRNGVIHLHYRLSV
jgi:hypothetical protein